MGRRGQRRRRRDQPLCVVAVPAHLGGQRVGGGWLLAAGFGAVHTLHFGSRSTDPFLPPLSNQPPTHPSTNAPTNQPSNQPTNQKQVREAGWAPQHVAARDAAGRLVGCCPLYLKGHSYGEYVFDNSWAQFYSMNGGR